MSNSWIWLLGATIAGLAICVPRYGLIAFWRRHTLVIARERVEDALKHLLEQEHRGRRASFQSLAGVLRLSDSALIRLAQRLESQGLVNTRGQDFYLTPDGERWAMQVVRAHRLWERYLADEARLPLERLHREAERREHTLDADQVDRLDASLGFPERDPHGDPIPTRDGRLAPDAGTPATSWSGEGPAQIVHLEDEPPLAFAQIHAEGLRIGQVVRVIDASPERILLTDGRREDRLAPAVAANVFLAAASADALTPPDVSPLSEAPDREDVEVVALVDSCQGFTRRRLLDLGFTPGARVTSEMRTFTGDPRAYRIRGVLVALRREQAMQILVKRASQARVADSDAGSPPARTTA